MQFLLVMLWVLILLTTGCSVNGARETDEVAWVVSMGVDRADDGDIVVGYRLALPAALAASEGGGAGDKETTAILAVKAPTLAEARNILNTSVSRAVNLSQVTAIAIGEDLARHGVQNLLGPLLRFREFRGTVFIIVCRGKALDALKANKPQIETLISRYIHNSVSSHGESSYYIPVSLHEFYTRLKSTSGAPLAVGYGVNPLSGEGQAVRTEPGRKTKTYLPGGLPREGGNPVEFSGMAVFKEDKMKGFFDTGETRVLSILLNRFEGSYFSVPDPLAPKYQVTLNLRNGRAPKITVDISGEKPVIHLDVLIEGEMTGNPSGISYEQPEYLQLLEAEIANLLQQQLADMLARAQEWEADVADFGYYIRPKFLTMSELKAYQWDKRFPQATITIKVKAEIRRTGLIRKTVEIRREKGD